MHQALAAVHPKYDPQERMLKEPFRSPGYHTTLHGGMIHSTRSSLHYAVALLDTGDRALLERAEAILRRVIALQDQDPNSKTYGLWSWFLEEPLAQMSPPDWNWADFCGVALLQVALDHRHRLSPDLAQGVDAAIQHAARSIRKRNVGPGYTNIAIMGAYVTMVAGELYGWKEMADYAKARWRDFCEYTREQGAFNEYNSPTYTIVALEELGRMLLHVQDPDFRRQAEAMHRLAWEEIALHFHAPTRQWAGPHSRAYSTLLDDRVLALVQNATQGRVNFGVDKPAMSDIRLPLACPADLEPYFTSLPRTRMVRKQFIAGQPPVVGTTCLAPEFALGTVSRGDLWNQRRALLAFWGDAKSPSYLLLRFLRDGYDFAAVQFFSAQETGRVLAAMNFATDGGGRHISLDRLKDGRFPAEDLRLRLEFGGAAGREKLTAPKQVEEPWTRRLGAATLDLRCLDAVFADEKPRWESGGDKEIAWLDLVLYTGRKNDFDLKQISEAAVGLFLELGPAGARQPNPVGTRADGKLRLSCGQLRLQIPTRPARAGELQKAGLNHW